MSGEKQDNSIGALWEKVDRNGNPYYPGKITIEGKEYHITLFKNQHHEEGDKRPYFRILPAIEREETNTKPERTEDEDVSF